MEGKGASYIRAAPNIRAVPYNRADMVIQNKSGTNIEIRKNAYLKLDLKGIRTYDLSVLAQGVHQNSYKNSQT